MLKIGQAKEIKILLLDNNGLPTTGTVSYVVYDETDTSFATGNMAVVAGVTGFYVMSFTPNAAGEWTIKLACGSPVRNAMKHFQVGEGVETDIFDILKVGGTGDLAAILADTNELQTDWKNGGRLDNLIDAIKAKTDTINWANITTINTTLNTHVTALTTHDADIKALLTTVQADLDSPNQYKADVSALALEATLGTHDTDIKALLNHATYGLSAIETLVDSLETVLGTKVDVADIDGTVTAKQQTLFANLHRYIGMVVADKTSLHANTTIVRIALEKKFHVDVLDDDDIDSGDADLEVYDIIFICGTVTDMTKINEITALGVPILTCNPEVALTILRLGDDSGGSGTSWGESAAQTQVNITNNTHQVVLTQTTGNLTVYDSASTVSWLRKTDLVAGVVQIAEIAGDNAKVCIAILPYDVNDEDGNPAPMPRLYWGINDPSGWNTTAENLFFDMVEWLLHQGRRTVEVEGIGKINQINQKLGTELSNADNLYDYIVTGSNEAGVFPAITANKVGSVLERMKALMQKDTTPAFDSDDDSLEAIREALDTHDAALTTHDTLLGSHDGDIKALLGHATYGLAALEALVDGIEGKTDNLPADPADASVIAADFDRHLTPLDFWGDPEDKIAITAVAGVKTLPNIIVPTLPTGATIWKVELIGFISNIVDSSGSDNAIDGAVNIQVKLTGTGTWRNAYDIQDDAFFVDVSEGPSRGGVPIRANLNNDDLGPNGYNEVTTAGTYEVQISSVASDGNLTLYDLQFGLRVWIY